MPVFEDEADAQEWVDAGGDVKVVEDWERNSRRQVLEQALSDQRWGVRSFERLHYLAQFEDEDQTRALLRELGASCRPGYSREMWALPEPDVEDCNCPDCRAARIARGEG